ncbi:hypothetical protein BVY04_01145 [bacterium M21]|nr:hypothetical protein BVY04_01145 [bacterium M21]
MLQVPGWLLLACLIIAQGIPAFGYEIGVRMGTQEPVSTITEVGAEFWYGFALGDLLTYIPILRRSHRSRQGQSFGVSPILRRSGHHRLLAHCLLGHRGNTLHVPLDLPLDLQILLRHISLKVTHRFGRGGQKCNPR